jgi:L-glutamine-phosphate cytidylyltransferase
VKAVILNAGMGIRLRPMTAQMPKCMIEINGKSVFEHQVDALKRNGISEIVVLVGHLKEKIVALRTDGMVFIENPVYDKTNASYSLWLAREHLRDQEFIYLNGDLLFHENILKMLLASDCENAIVVEKKEGGRDDSFKATMAGNRILKMQKLSTGKETCIEVPGPVRFSKKGSARLFEILDEKVRSGDFSHWVYAVISQIATEINLSPVFITDLPWAEIDDLNDLQRARAIFENPSE